MLLMVVCIAGLHYRALLYAQVRTVAGAHLLVATARAAYFGSEDTEHVSRDELLRRSRDGHVVDVRPREEYEAGHIPGAVSIPFDELVNKLDAVPADQDIVAYCRGSYCVLAHDAVRLLSAHGRTARRLADGMLEWRLADLPVESP